MLIKNSLLLNLISLIVIIDLTERRGYQVKLEKAFSKNQNIWTLPFKCRHFYIYGTCIGVPDSVLPLSATSPPHSLFPQKNSRRIKTSSDVKQIKLRLSLGGSWSFTTKKVGLLAERNAEIENELCTKNIWS